MTIHQSPEGKKLLAARLYRDFNALKTYGKEPESLHSIISLFGEALADYAWDEVNAAMTEHVRKSPEFPTPSDIVSLIDEARKEREKRENAIAWGVDDSPDKLREYRERRDAGHRLSPKEHRILREYGWKLDVPSRG